MVPLTNSFLAPKSGWCFPRNALNNMKIDEHQTCLKARAQQTLKKHYPLTRNSQPRGWWGGLQDSA